MHTGLLLHSFLWDKRCRLDSSAVALVPVCKRTQISRSVMARLKDLIGTDRTWEIKVTVDKKPNQELSRLVTTLRGVSKHIVEHTRGQEVTSTPATIFEACYCRLSCIPGPLSQPSRSRKRAYGSPCDNDNQHFNKKSGTCTWFLKEHGHDEPYSSMMTTWMPSMHACRVTFGDEHTSIRSNAERKSNEMPILERALNLDTCIIYTFLSKDCEHITVCRWAECRHLLGSDSANDIASPTTSKCALSPETDDDTHKMLVANPTTDADTRILQY